MGLKHSCTIAMFNLVIPAIGGVHYRVYGIHNSMMSVPEDETILRIIGKKRRRRRRLYEKQHDGYEFGSKKLQEIIDDVGGGDDSIILDYVNEGFEDVFGDIETVRDAAYLTNAAVRDLSAAAKIQNTCISANANDIEHLDDAVRKNQDALDLLENEHDALKG